LRMRFCAQKFSIASCGIEMGKFGIQQNPNR
jgi:hypothetical protein